jgi:hypothetical protein
MFILSSTNVGQIGFKFGVEITETLSGRVYFFFYSPDINDSKLYFDLSPLVLLRNNESSNNIHSGTTVGTYSEPEGSGWLEYSLEFTEWWLVAGVLTKNVGVTSTDTCKVFNGYYQPSDGYKPNANSGNTGVKFSLNNTNSFLWSDREQTTHVWPLASTYTPLISNGVYIPAFPNDYGMMYLSGTNDLPSNSPDKYRISFYDGINPAPIVNEVNLQGLEIEGIPCYPANLDNNGDGFPFPSTYPQWTHYVLQLFTAGNLARSFPYVFYNADKFGLTDCRFDVVRLAWVGSRCGWEYQNFTKRSENTYQIERRQYRQVLPNNFNSATRQKTDRQNIANKSITVVSDWLQEGEFDYLKGLLISNQVQIVNADGTQTPVNIEDSSYISRRERTGRLFNLTLKINYSQEYWS